MAKSQKLEVDEVILNKEEAMEKTKGRETRRARADSPMVVETEVEKSFWLSRPDGWEIEVVPMVAGQRSVREKEWLEALKIFGIGKEEG